MDADHVFMFTVLARTLSAAALAVQGPILEPYLIAEVRFQFMCTKIIKSEALVFVQYHQDVLQVSYVLLAQSVVMVLTRIPAGLVTDKARYSGTS